MKLLSCDFEGLVINSKRVSELFEEQVLKETGRESGNWVSSDQAIWFLREITGMENAEMTCQFFIPTITAFPTGQVEAMWCPPQRVHLVGGRLVHADRTRHEFQCREAKIHPRGCTWRVSDVRDALE